MKRRIVRVSQMGRGDHKSITAALAEATAGDFVVVAAGTYSVTTTAERFPLYIPPGVSLVGSGAAGCVIDGEGALNWSWRPFRSDQSLLIVRDRSTLSGFTVQNSGGCAVSVLRGAHCTISDNVIRSSGLHGLLVTGPNDVVIRRNAFANNGTAGVAIPIYRPQPARPGENIFVVGTSGHDNRVLIERNDVDGSANQESITIITDPDDEGAIVKARVYDNKIASARVALLLVGSFGGSRNRLDLELVGNEIRAAAIGIVVGGAYPVVRREACGNAVTVMARGNVIRDCSNGMQLLGAFGPARDNHITADIVDNALLNITGTALRAVGAVANQDAATINNTVTCRVVGNTTSNISGRSVVVDGAAMEVPSGVLAFSNVAEVQLGDNNWQQHDGSSAVLLRSGPAGNEARLTDGGFACDVEDTIAMWQE